MPNSSSQKVAYEKWAIIDFRGLIETKHFKISILVTVTITANMPKSGMQKYCSLLKPKISPQKESNERNAKESSITVNSFQLRRGNLFKSKKKIFKILQTCFAAQLHVQIILHSKAKALSFYRRDITNCFKSWIQLWSNKCTLPFFVSYNQEAALNPQSVFKTHLKKQQIIMFLHGLRKAKFATRKVWGLCTLWSSILSPP